ncbi:hypothetical protein FF38_08114 [Lucilia cuprina]|uniref:Uncharacterized protein n=1 Tax=Lucilia cuprina TaxID=7375 RepID=A0A0L0CKU2_LUCCU|nr:hypothetical protein FF38_08114 [Lucilia cuprina]
MPALVRGSMDRHAHTSQSQENKCMIISYHRHHQQHHYHHEHCHYRCQSHTYIYTFNIVGNDRLLFRVEKVFSGSGSLALMLAGKPTNFSLSCHNQSAISCSAALAVSLRGVAITPALLTKISSLCSSARKRSANCLTEDKEAKSKVRLKTLGFCVRSMISKRAASQRAASLQAIYKRAPLLANSKAVSLPIPVLQPVTITTLPSIRLGLR